VRTRTKQEYGVIASKCTTLLIRTKTGMAVRKKNKVEHRNSPSAHSCWQLPWDLFLYRNTIIRYKKNTVQLHRQLRNRKRAPTCTNAATVIWNAILRIHSLRHRQIVRPSSYKHRRQPIAAANTAAVVHPHHTLARPILPLLCKPPLGLLRPRQIPTPSEAATRKASQAALRFTPHPHQIPQSTYAAAPAAGAAAAAVEPTLPLSLHYHITAWIQRQLRKLQVLGG